MDNDNTTEGVVYFNLKAYYDELKTRERRLPKDARRLPTMKVLATEVGTHPTNLSRLVRGDIRQVDMGLVGRLMHALRRRGFPVTTADLFVYEEVDLGAPE